MPIIGLTHNEDGTSRVSRSVTTKVAIGLPPKDDRDHPKRLDHFVFLEKGLRNGKPGWFPNEGMTKLMAGKYGQNPREFWITFLDNDVDTVFRTSYSAYVSRGCWCRGDGVHAQRRAELVDLKKGAWPDFKPFAGPCANPDAKGNHCPFIDDRKCAPSGDLYFMLADFPALGSICRLHTSSYQSIRQIYSGLIDIKNVSGGRLMGLSAKLFVHPDKSIFEQGGVAKSGVKHVLGLEVRAEDLAGLQQKMLETATAFQNIKGLLGAQTVQIEDDDEEEIAREFYHEADITIPAGQSVEPEKQAPQGDSQADIDRVHELLTAMGKNQAQRDAEIGKHKGKLREYRAQVEELYAKRQQGTKQEPPAQPAAKGKKAASRQAPAASQPQQQDPLEITDEDAATFGNEPPPKAKQEDLGFDF